MSRILALTEKIAQPCLKIGQGIISLMG